MLGAGAAARLGEAEQRGGGHQEQEQHHLEDGEQPALQSGKPVGAPEGIPPVQEKYPGQNAADESTQAEQDVQIAAGQPQDHAEGAAQEHQAADHDEEAQHEAGQRGAAAPGGELLPGQGQQKAAQHQSDDLGADVLHRGGGVETKGSGGVPQEAGDAEAHVDRIAEEHQQGCEDTDDDAGQNDAGGFLFQVHPLILLP